VTSSRARRALALGALCTVVGPAVDARAEDVTKEQCVEANENAQALRQDGKLRAARTQLAICLAQSCPGPVRDDCAERMSEVERAAPTIVFAVKGGTGDTLHAVQVTMDGAPLADHLDGSALVVDPGEHVFTLAADGYTAVSKRLVIREGMKARKEVVTLKSARPSPEAPPVPVASPAKPVPPRSNSSGSGQRTLAYVLGGAGIVSGVVGTYFGFRAKSTYDQAVSVSNCPTGLSSCTQAALNGNNRAHGEALVSTVAFVVGGGLVASGVVLFVSTSSDAAIRVQPSVGTSAAGIRLGGDW
jgi:hypothetical protein